MLVPALGSKSILQSNLLALGCKCKWFLFTDTRGSHYWHLGLDNCGLWVTVLCITVCLASSLASTHWIQKALHATNCDSQNCLQTMSNNPSGGKTTFGWEPQTSFTLKVLGPLDAESICRERGQSHLKLAIRKISGSEVTYHSTKNVSGPTYRGANECPGPRLRPTAGRENPGAHGSAAFHTQYIRQKNKINGPQSNLRTSVFKVIPYWARGKSLFLFFLISP